MFHYFYQTYIAVSYTHLGINALSNPYWHYANIIPQEAITKDYDYLKIAIEGTLTDHWKIQVGDCLLYTSL